MVLVCDIILRNYVIVTVFLATGVWIINPTVIFLRSISAGGQK